MESEIIERLEGIERMLLIQSVIFAILMLAFLVIIVQSFVVRRAEIKAAIKQGFINDAMLLEDEGKYSELLELSNNRLKKYQNDVVAKWYSALSLYQLQRYGESLNQLSEIQAMDPVWQREMVEDYINDIRNRLDGPRRP